ncbi:hypothetical protein T06_14531 [Trichinella sp. T6]|nr:hypothetical protein T06_14531 [Trichinella sp. T6]
MSVSPKLNNIRTNLKLRRRPGAVKFIMFPSCSFMGFKHFKRMPTHVFFGQTNHLALDLRIHMLKQKHHSCQY